MCIDRSGFDVDLPEPLSPQTTRVPPGVAGSSARRWAGSGTQTVSSQTRTERGRSSASNGARGTRGPKQPDVAGGAKGERPELLSTRLARTKQGTQRRPSALSAPTTADDLALPDGDVLVDEQHGKVYERSSNSRTTKRLPRGAGRGRRFQLPYWRKIHPLAWFGGGMIAVITGMYLLSVGIGAYVNYENTQVSPPTDHIVLVRGQYGFHDATANSQGMVFVDAQQHLCLLFIPGGDDTKARIITGPDLSTQMKDAQHARLLVQVVRRSDGVDFHVVAESPLLVQNGFFVERHGVEWTFHIEGSGNGGK